MELALTKIQVAKLVKLANSQCGTGKKEIWATADFLQNFEPA